MEFLDKISAFIPLLYRHRWHYHGVFAPNAPLRKQVTYKKDSALQITSSCIEGVVKKIKRVSLDWAQLIERIYEVNPLTCSQCGKMIKIIGFVTHQAEIHRILKSIGWPLILHYFDLLYDLSNRKVCQLIPGTEDGFPIIVSLHIGLINGYTISMRSFLVCFQKRKGSLMRQLFLIIQFEHRFFQKIG